MEKCLEQLPREGEESETEECRIDLCAAWDGWVKSGKPTAGSVMKSDMKAKLEKEGAFTTMMKAGHIVSSSSGGKENMPATAHVLKVRSSDSSVTRDEDELPSKRRRL